MTPEAKFKTIYLIVALAGVFVLGMFSPWLKTHGSTIYVAASLGYLVVLALAARFIGQRLSRTTS